MRNLRYVADTTKTSEVTTTTWDTHRVTLVSDSGAAPSIAEPHSATMNPQPTTAPGRSGSTSAITIGSARIQWNSGLIRPPVSIASAPYSADDSITSAVRITFAPCGSARR